MLVDTVIGFEFPYSRLPLIHYEGPLFSRNNPMDRLTHDIQNWLNSAGADHGRGVVFISMGSIVCLTREMAWVIVTSIHSANYSILWRRRCKYSQ